MANLFEAEAAGLSDGMTSSAPRTVPAQFTGPAADAYLEAFDRMRQSLRGCVPAPPQERLPPKIKPPAAAGKTARVKPTPAPKPASVPTLPPKPPMEAALERLLQSA